MSSYEYKRYSFAVKWDERISERTRRFLLFYYFSDGAVEMHDMGTNRLFLKRTKINAITLDQMHIGAVLNIFNRHMVITDFGDEYTRNKLAHMNERTFAMLKPSVMDRIGEILNFIRDHNYRIARLKMVSLRESDINILYEEHLGKSFMGVLSDYLTSGPSLGMELVGDQAVCRWRELMGPTEPRVALEESPSSLRALYGIDITRNGFHGSATKEDAKRELDIIFSSETHKTKTVPVTSALLEGTTLCLIKPHAIRAGLLGDIVQDIERNGFKVTAMEMFSLTVESAEELYILYKGITNEYREMVNEVLMGPCVAVEVMRPEGDTWARFREYVGPKDPEHAKVVKPNSLRAKFGVDAIHNAVYTTDLEESSKDDVLYFFSILQHCEL
ncbi:nucleoside diphosphate kinase 7 isoform X2 [Bacillus rossius redtenbacheri]|uniref:nucleoside diphosphate kinase 7 isoform X2 n=1 Tax=Bacillus rossius redtenbacheri TaxID=93214 RepID=UPI002FDC7EA4